MIKKLPRILLVLLISLGLLPLAYSATSAQKDTAKWKQASQHIISNKTKLAKRKLLELLRNSTISKDLIYLTLGRLSFQDGKFNQAVQHYLGVNQDSPYWLEAKEELAWTYIRLNQPTKAIVHTATVLSPVFLGQLGPEPYFLDAYANLMICDYEKIFSVGQSFKKNERKKVEELEKLSSGKASQVLSQAFIKLKKGPFHTSTIAKELPILPRNFLRDVWFQKFWLSQNISRAQKRIQTLAKIELKEYRKIIHKLHLLEAEVIQRLYLKESKIGTRKKITKKIVKNAETLTFPETGEIWVDELDNYHLDAKDCPKIMQVKL